MEFMHSKPEDVRFGMELNYQGHTGRGIQGGRRRLQAACAAGGPPPKLPYGRLGGGPPAGRITVMHCGPACNFRESMDTPSRMGL
jgi:hypothetical protein